MRLGSFRDRCEQAVFLRPRLLPNLVHKSTKLFIAFHLIFYFFAVTHGWASSLIYEFESRRDRRMEHVLQMRPTADRPKSERTQGNLIIFHLLFVLRVILF